MSIPVVDFGAYSLSEEDVSDEHMHNLSKELESAFTQVGFVYLKNTGITQEEVDRVLSISKTFFLQPDEVKRPFSRSTFAISPNHGWVCSESERLNPCRPGDLKEAFNISSFHPDIKWPSGAVKEFQEIQTSFFQRCKELSLRVLKVMAHSLGLDPEVFLSAHRLIGSMLTHGALHCCCCCWVQADVGSGAVLINVADLMQRWTSDHFISVVHRVLLPPAGDSSTRQSMAFFVQPDDEALITCIDGSNKYPPVTAGDYITERFSRSY
ncbi:uncharacterized protein LOC141766903 [Sebastes fasciatus]|uniref:uncharacterized protein LOC141766903 n=1 Tax=Sebastes fasciatus TaxID=394691 RepID=UPI003D9F3924